MFSSPRLPWIWCFAGAAAGVACGLWLRPDPADGAAAAETRRPAVKRPASVQPPPPVRVSASSPELHLFAGVDEALAAMEAATAGQENARPSLPSTKEYGQWSPADLRAAVLSLLRKPESPHRDRLIDALLHRWRLADPEAAAAFTREHRPAEQEAIDSAAQNAEWIAGLSLEEARHAALSAGPRPDWNALSSAVTNQVRENPDAAIAFLEAHMDEITRGEGSWRLVLGNAAMIWSQSDAAAAVEWAATLPPGPARDQAIGGAVQAVSKYDPAAALAWMATMQHPNSGSSDLQQVVARLSSQIGTIGARRVLERTPFPDATKQKLLESLQ